MKRILMLCLCAVPLVLGNHPVQGQDGDPIAVIKAMSVEVTSLHNVWSTTVCQVNYYQAEADWMAALRRQAEDARELVLLDPDAPDYDDELYRLDWQIEMYRLLAEDLDILIYARKTAAIQQYTEYVTARDELVAYAMANGWGW